MRKSEFIQLNLGEPAQPHSKLGEKEMRLPTVENELSRPVIEHLLARKNLRPPFNDGKKNSGFFAGGLMTAIRAVGVADGLQQSKLDYGFDELYGSSAGFAVASDFLTPGGPRRVMESDIKLSRNPFKVADPEYYLPIMDEVKSFEVESVLRHPTKLFSRVRNLRGNKCKFIDAKSGGRSHFFESLKATMNLPVIGGDPITIEGQEYGDPIRLKDMTESIDEILKGDASDVLIVISNLKQLKYLRKQRPKIFNDSRVLVISPDIEKDNISPFQLRKAPLVSEAWKMQKKTVELFRGSDEN